MHRIKVDLRKVDVSKNLLKLKILNFVEKPLKTSYKIMIICVENFFFFAHFSSTLIIEVYLNQFSYSELAWKNWTVNIE